MTVALIHPPLADPTMPYVAVPLLTAVLRRAGHDVLAIDANAEATAALLSRDALHALEGRVRAQFTRLDRQPLLHPAEQRAYVALFDALAAAAGIADRIGAALSVLRDPTGRRFFDPAAYAGAVDTVERALTLLGAAHTPLQLDFTAYRTPFAWLDGAEIRADAAPERDPFSGYARDVLVPRLRAANVALIGLSIAFPGQLQPAWSLAYALRAALPGVTLVAGGPALTQRFAPLAPDEAERLRAPFDALVLFEGEQALLGLVDAVRRGERPAGVVRGTPVTDLATLPAPDFADLSASPYLAPRLVLPYDASRGCYWGRCAFCHYGLAECGTARYRGRPPERVAADLHALAERHDVGLFYLSHDTLAPRLGLALARQLAGGARRLRWASDVRPERAFAAPGVAAELARGGLLAASLGLESAAPRVLERIDKGVTVPEARDTARALAAAGVAVEAMVFTDFPGETAAEALETLRWLAEARGDLALFVCGTFDLTAGSRVAREPAHYGIRDLWTAAGDAFRAARFYTEARPGKRPAERAAIDEALDRVARHYRLRRYPWAGALSTAHTLLWYERYGPTAFKTVARRAGAPPREPAPPRARYDVAALAERTAREDAAIWTTLTHELRAVSRALYEERAARLPLARPPHAPTGRPHGAQPPRRTRRAPGRR